MVDSDGGLGNDDKMIDRLVLAYDIVSTISWVLFAMTVASMACALLFDLTSLSGAVFVGGISASLSLTLRPHMEK